MTIRAIAISDYHMAQGDVVEVKCTCGIMADLRRPCPKCRAEVTDGSEKWTGRLIPTDRRDQRKVGDPPSKKG